MNEEEEIIERLSGELSDKIQEIAGEINGNNSVRRPNLGRGFSSFEKSVIETNPFRKRKAPFVRLSGEMETFIRDIKSLSKTGIPGSVVKALSEGDDTEGGFLVPEEFLNVVVEYVNEKAVIRPRARVFTMARDRLTLPKLDQSTDRFGGLDLYWTSEGDTKVETQPVFGKITLNVKKLIGLVVSSDELLADSAVNLANYLIRLFSDAIAWEEDFRFLRGTGLGQPLGILNTVGMNVVARNTSAEIRLVDILGMYAAHPAWADANAVWLTTKAGMAQLMAIGQETTGGVHLFMMNLKDKVSPTLQGKEIVLTEKLPALGTEGDIILADLDYYYIGDKKGIEVATSIHDRFRNDETTFRFVKRVDGQPSIPSAFTVLSP